MNNVLVIGGSGFIGKNLNYINRIHEKEIRLFGYEEGEIFRLNQVQEIGNFVEDRQISTLISLAWPLKNDYRHNPSNTLVANQTLNLYRDLDKVLKRFISVGTFSETMKDLDGKNRLDDSLYAQSKRRLSKGLAEHFTPFGHTVTLRIGCPFGPWDRESRLIPSLVKASLGNLKLSINNPSVVLPMIHVYNIAAELLSLVNDKSIFSNTILDYFGDNFLTVEAIGQAIEILSLRAKSGLRSSFSLEVPSLRKNTLVSFEDGILDLILKSEIT